MAHILAIANQKGGCGKTTTAVSVAAGLALRGRRVLLIDLDPQANASLSFGIDIESAHTTIYELLIRADLGMEYGIFRKGALHIVPSKPQLAVLEGGEHAVAPTRLADLLRSIEPQYDFIVIDAPPSIGKLTEMALSAAKWVIVPVDVGYYALVGIRQLLAKLEGARRYNSAVDILGFLVTHYDPRNNLSRQVAEKIEESFPGRLFSEQIRSTVRLREAPGHHMTIFEYDRGGTAAQNYLAVTDEVIQRCEK